jgi:RNA polymerase sigma-70 factor (ECF subfamily)
MRLNSVPRPRSAADPRAVTGLAEVRPLAPARSDVELIEGLRARERWAQAAVFDRHAGDVQRILAWVLGVDRDLPDLLHDVFLKAFDGIGDLADAERLRPWLLSIAVYTAKECIRRRQRSRWYRAWLRRETATRPVESISPEVREVVGATRKVLELLDPDERIAFTLRYMAGLGLEQAADACGVSLATIKRRIAAARERFTALAFEDPVLREWLETGATWPGE